MNWQMNDQDRRKASRFHVKVRFGYMFGLDTCSWTFWYWDRSKNEPETVSLSNFDTFNKGLITRFPVTLKSFRLLQECLIKMLWSLNNLQITGHHSLMPWNSHYIYYHLTWIHFECINGWLVELNWGGQILYNIFYHPVHI